MSPSFPWGWTAAVLAAAVAFPLAVHADPATVLPPGTDAHAGVPPYVPHTFDDEGAVRAWCDAAVAAAHETPDARVGGALLLSAAWALDHRCGDEARALSLYEAAAARLPADAPAAGAAWLRVSALRLETGRVDAAALALAAARRFEGRGPPPTATQGERRRWRLVWNRLAWEVPRLEADVAEARGDLASAAAHWERLAASAERAGHDDTQVAALLARAARLRARAGDRAAALADVDRALELARDARQVADLTSWRLHLRHGLLTESGEVGLTAAPADAAFVRDAHVALRRLQGNPHVGKHALTLASRASVSGRPADALGLYRIAFTDPAFVDAARTREDLWRGMLAAFPVAVRLKRFDDADRILDAVASVATMSREELDGYRASVAEARDEALDAPPIDRAEAPPTTPREPGHLPHQGRLRPAPAREGQGVDHEGGALADGDVEEGDVEEGPASPVDPAVGFAVALAVVFLLRLVLQRRRRTNSGARR